jgi:hypothetical protein
MARQISFRRTTAVLLPSAAGYVKEKESTFLAPAGIKPARREDFIACP